MLLTSLYENDSLKPVDIVYCLFVVIDMTYSLLALMTVSSVPDSGLSSAVKAGIYVAVVLMMAAALLGGVIFCHPRSSKKGKYYLQII